MNASRNISDYHGGLLQFPNDAAGDADYSKILSWILNDAPAGDMIETAVISTEQDCLQ
jgi:hypothetical protein